MNTALKLCTDGRIEIITVPDTGLLEWCYSQIGADIIETVNPQGLEYPYMLIMDEEALLRNRPVVNFLASWLYKTQEHGHPICGTVLIMQHIMTPDGPDIGGVPYDEAQELASGIACFLPEAVLSVRKILGI